MGKKYFVVYPIANFSPIYESRFVVEMCIGVFRIWHVRLSHIFNK